MNLAVLFSTFYFLALMAEAITEVHGAWSKIFACKEGINAIRAHEEVLINAEVSILIKHDLQHDLRSLARSLN